MYEIETERLRLITCSAETALAAANNRDEAEKVLGVPIHPFWFEAHLMDFLPIYAAQIGEHPEMLGWGVWLMIHKADNLMIGDLGFKGAPVDGTIEIGYEIAPNYRQQNLTFEAVAALIKWAFAHSEVTKIVAECFPDNPGSVRVLEKVGMQRTGTYFNEQEQHTVVTWELNKKDEV